MKLQSPTRRQPVPTMPLRHALPLFALLALVMGATRIHHFAAIPDASWAVFFTAGFYLRRHWRWAFPLLMSVAVLADAHVISKAGIDFWGHYCVSPAYAFLLPSYLALWLGGVWLARRAPVFTWQALNWQALGWLGVSFLIATSLCYLLSNGSFYWLSDSWGGTRSLGGWLTNLGHWYLPYLRTTGLYLALAALLHVAVLAALAASLRTASRHTS